MKLNTDESPGVATEYGIRSIPTIIIFKNGQKQETIIGAVPKPTLVTSIEKVGGGGGLGGWGQARGVGCYLIALRREARREGPIACLEQWQLSLLQHDQGKQELGQRGRICKLERKVFCRVPEVMTSLWSTRDWLE